MIDETFMLFGEEPGLEEKQAHGGTPVIEGVARVLMPNRAQIELRASDLESLLPEGIGRGLYGPMSNKRTSAGCMRGSGR